MRGFATGTFLGVVLLMVAAGLPLLASASPPADTTPPIVYIYSPVDQQSMRGVYDLVAISDDAGGTQSMEFFADGVSVGFGTRTATSQTGSTWVLPWDTRVKPDGAVVAVTARATDMAGNSATGGPVSAPVDNTPPETALLTKPPAHHNQTSATFSFTGSDNITPSADITYAYTLDGVTKQLPLDVSSVTVTGLSQGSHTFEVKARDRAGNFDPTPVTYTFSVDTVAPGGRFYFADGVHTKSTVITLWFDPYDTTPVTGISETRVGSEGPNGVEWRPWDPFVARRQWTLTPGDGPKAVYVQYRDAADNRSNIMMDFIVLDTVPPDVTLHSGPTGYVSSRSAVFEFSKTESTGGTQCALDGGEYLPCTSPHEYQQLPDGAHTVAIRANDEAGNVDPTPATRSWTVDLTPPVVGVPAHGLDTSTDTGAVRVRLRWCATGCSTDVARYELQESADGGVTYAAVPLPTATTKTVVRPLQPGAAKYRYRLRAQDHAGNWGAYRTGTAFGLTAYQEDPLAGATTHPVTYPSGVWSRGALTGSYGGYVRYVSTAGATARLSVPVGGKSVAWVSNRASSRGKADVWVDGVFVATLDLYRAATQMRQVVWSRALDPHVAHTVEVRVRADRNASSTGARVDVDAFVVTR